MYVCDVSALLVNIADAMYPGGGILINILMELCGRHFENPTVRYGENCEKHDLHYGEIVKNIPYTME